MRNESCFLGFINTKGDDLFQNSDLIMEDRVNTEAYQTGSLAAFLMGFLTKLLLLSKIIFVSKWQKYLKDECKKEKDGTPEHYHRVQHVT